MTDPEAALSRVQTVSELLDSAVTIPLVGIDVGLDPIIGLIPVVGDAATAVVALYVVAEAWRAGASRWTLARMLANVGLDLLIGAVPVVGDAFDVAFRANERNAALFERHLEG